MRPRLLDGPVFYLALPARLASALRDFEPDVVVVQGVHEAAAVLAARLIVRSRARVILDVQGDWHAATRLYGSRARRLLNPLSDAIGASVVHRVDGIRTLSGFTSSVVRASGAEPIAEFPPFVDAAAFLAPPVQPLPAVPAALFVGVLERYKGFDTLAAAWPRVVEAVPGAELHIVGRGTLAPLAHELVRGGARWTESLDARGVSVAMDASHAAVPAVTGRGPRPRRPRGDVPGRAAWSAAARAVSAISSRRESTGCSSTRTIRRQLAAALVAVLGDPDTAARLGDAARRTGEEWSVTPEQYAGRLESLVRHVLGRPS